MSDMTRENAVLELEAQLEERPFPLKRNLRIALRMAIAALREPLVEDAPRRGVDTSSTLPTSLPPRIANLTADPEKQLQLLHSCLSEHLSSARAELDRNRDDSALRYLCHAMEDMRDILSFLERRPQTKGGWSPLGGTEL